MQHIIIHALPASYNIFTIIQKEKKIKHQRIIFRKFALTCVRYTSYNNKNHEISKNPYFSHNSLFVLRV